MAWFSPPNRNFARVEPGALYRSAQPGSDALRVLKQRYHIRTIINLRSPNRLKTAPLARQEIAFARENGINFINLPYNGHPPEAQVAKFLAIAADPANRPILVHCAAGKERTGVMIAAYRILEQGWPLSAALAEMKSFGFKSDEKPEMVRVVQNIAQRKS